MTSDLQVAVLAAGAAAASGGVTPGRAVEETAVFVAAAVLLQDVPHLRLEERHVHVDGHHLNESEAAAPLETDSNCTGNGRTFTFIEQLHLFYSFLLTNLIVVNQILSFFLSYFFHRKFNLVKIPILS